MSTCPNCNTEIEDGYSHCWNCGSKLTATSSVTEGAAPDVPQFASVETNANLPNVKSVQESQTSIRTCRNCQTEIEGGYSHCWHCGSKLSAAATQSVTGSLASSVPQFASVEPDANIPDLKSVQVSATATRTCPNCKTQVEDKYSHCWNCGSKLIAQPVIEKSVSAGPQFTPVKTDANLPNVNWRWFRHPVVRVVLGLVMLGILKILGSAFVGTYGLYIFIGVAVVAMLIILWRSFRRDPTEGVGIEL